MRTLERTRTQEAAAPPRFDLIRLSIIAALLLMASSWVFILLEDRNQSHSFFSVETAQRAWGLLRDLLGIGASQSPAFLRLQEWKDMGSLAYQTLAMSVLGIGFAGIVALLTFMFGARNVMVGDLAPYSSWVWRSGFVITRALFIFTRGVPELIWAMIVIFAFSPGILAGALALAIHNSGVLGKLAAEVVEGLDPRPIRALRSAGAGSFQTLAYGVLPQAIPQFITYLFYRWEIIIRTTIVVGFVAAGGLGTEFRLSMSYFQYTSVTLIIIWYLLLVIAVDIIATMLRRLAR